MNKSSMINTYINTQCSRTNNFSYFLKSPKVTDLGAPPHTLLSTLQYLKFSTFLNKTIDGAYINAQKL